MEKVFVKNGEIKTVNGGYVVLVSNETPVANQAFIAAQKHAEYIVEFAKEAKGKNFTGTKPDSLDEVKRKVSKRLYDEQTKEYIATEDKPKMDITKKLEAEALNFIKFQEGKSNTDKVNSFLQQFNVISEFEEFGLFFDKAIVKLNKIYTMEEIIDAAKQVVNLAE